MGTSTQVKPEAKASAVTSTKLVNAIKAMVLSVITTFSLKRAVSSCLRSESDRLKLDPDGARKLAADSWCLAYRQDIPSLMADNPSWSLATAEAANAVFAMKARPDVSKAMRLAYPASDKAQQELDKAYAHNDKLPANTPKANRIGENTLLEIARGNTTYADAIAVKAATKNKKSSGLDSVNTPEERFQLSIKGILNGHHIGDKGKLTADQARECFNVALDAYLNPVSPKAEAAKAQASKKAKVK